MLFAIIQHSQFSVISDCFMFFLWRTKIPEITLLSLCDSLLAAQLEKSWAKLHMAWVAHLRGSSHLLCHPAIWMAFWMAPFGVHQTSPSIFSCIVTVLLSSPAKVAVPALLWMGTEKAVNTCNSHLWNFPPAPGTYRVWSSRVWATQPHFCSGCWSCISTPTFHLLRNMLLKRELLSQEEHILGNACVSTLL